MKKRELLNRFLGAISDGGDMFFSTGVMKRDLEIIKATIARQGYWAGVSTRYFFDEEFNLLRTEERRFGS